MRRLLRYPLLAVLAAGCSASSVTPVQDGGALEDGDSDETIAPAFDAAPVEANADDPDPSFGADEWAALLALSPAPLPAAPADISNRFADNPAAAALGQRLFFDPAFSGPLLDADNDGSASTLGKVGETGRVACAGCHLPADGFSDTRSFQRQISLGAGWGRRRAPSLLDVGQAKVVMWDGRHDALYNQILGPLESVVEMNSSRLYMAEQIQRRYRAEYEAVFGPLPALDDPAQFPQLGANVTGCVPMNPTDPQPACDGPFHGMPGDHAEFDGLTDENKTAVTTVIVNAGKAIGAYERLLSCGAGPFDTFMHGDPSALSRAAQRGAAIFVGKGSCVGCHAGPFLSDQTFHNVGLAPQVVQQAFLDSNDRGAATGIASALADPLSTRGSFSDGDDGRLAAASTPPLEGSFRTPILRCVSMRPAFMHTGQLRTLAKVVDFFDTGGAASGYPGANELRPLALSPREQADLVAFLEALQGPGPAASLLAPPASGP